MAVDAQPQVKTFRSNVEDSVGRLTLHKLNRGATGSEQFDKRNEEENRAYVLKSRADHKGIAIKCPLAIMPLSAPYWLRCTSTPSFSKDVSCRQAIPQMSEASF